MAAEKSSSDLTLLDFWVSPFGQRVRIALAEKSLPYEYVEEDLLAGKSDRLLQSNPVHKKIPVLLHGGKPLNESLIIVQYLDEAFPDTPSLLPADPYARAQARFWADYVDKKVYDCGSRLWKLKGEPQAQARAEMLEILKTLETELGDKEFFGGEHGFGFVDAAFAPFTPWFMSYEKYGEFKVAEVAPKIAAWAERVGKRESVAKSLYSPDKVYDFIGVLKKMYGIE
ncbi:probable glutathione S-transferase GSTU1 [Lolium rigidum]|uniref:probable glutathione S-transferase GSTU1 n=1 Tax=Lolium rigidum TaxID=89674 RepID=UPI001F5D8669|nr:probable glutathione S-transferase GSTU1 [Lolium rigidum]